MAKLAKFLQGVAGAAGGAALNVEDVFSTYLYEGNGSTQTITNGIDLDGEGGMVWTKQRTGAASSNVLVDTERGTNAVIYSDLTNAEFNTGTNTLTAFNNNGYDLGSNTNFNRNNEDNVSWTFRKAPKFFDVVTYTGNGTAGRTVSHNLGTDVGFMVIKQTSASGEHWICYHRSLGASNPIYLNLTSAASSTTSLPFNSTAPTSTEFTLGSWVAVNGNGASYVAYLFAHNNGDGEFGPTGDQDIIKCGSWTGAGATEVSVSLGFEPQWLLVKKTSSTDDWYIIDNMRGQPFGANVTLLSPNTSSNEQESLIASPTPDGLITKNWSNGANFIYIAIRRGPMAVPESATDVFDIATRDGTEPHFNSNFDTVDFALYRSNISTSGDWYAATRLTTNEVLVTNSSAAEVDGGTGFVMDFSGGWYGNSSANSSSYSWMWRRAPNYFDVVCYDGDGTSSHTINHNLGVVPEMMWFKRRDSSTAGNWLVYHSSYLTTQALFINSSGALISNQTGNLQSTPSDSSFTVGSYNGVNNSSGSYIAYLFASLDGVSKVGSFTTSGSDVDVDCGFSAGPRFVLIKNTASGNWFVMDSERGITSGNDAFLTLNTTNAESSSLDLIDINPTSSGFTVNRGSFGDGTFIFYAIA